MNPFLNLFLSIAVPVSALFITFSTFYFSINYNLNNSIKLGTVTGVLSAAVFSILITGVILLMRRARSVQTENKPQNTIIYEEEEEEEELLEQTLLLLMDKEQAFEVAIHSIIDQEIGNVREGDKHKGTMSINTATQMISIAVSTLTQHTSKVEVKVEKYTPDIKKIITYIKIKEHSFLQY